MKTRIYLFAIITLLCISCKDKKTNAIQTKSNLIAIDTTIQKVAENALHNQLEALNANAGIVVVMDAKTGTVKAIANKNISENDTIETASLSTVPCMIVALDDSVISPDDKIDTGNGVLKYKGVTITDYNSNRGGFGKVTAEQVVTLSSNVGAAKIILKGYENNPDKLIDGLHQLGFTDISKDNPVADFLLLGYGIKMPVIQIMKFYNSIANGTVKCSPATLKAIKKMLADAVIAGTGSPAKSDKITIAGKTGSLNDTALFCGYFPVDNPQYSCIVVIQNPKNGNLSGGFMAGNVFKEIAEAIY